MFNYKFYLRDYIIIVMVFGGGCYDYDFNICRSSQILSQILLAQQRSREIIKYLNNNGTRTLFFKKNKGIHNSDTHRSLSVWIHVSILFIDIYDHDLKLILVSIICVYKPDDE